MKDEVMYWEDAEKNIFVHFYDMNKDRRWIRIELKNNGPRQARNIEIHISAFPKNRFDKVDDLDIGKRVFVSVFIPRFMLKNGVSIYWEDEDGVCHVTDELLVRQKRGRR